LGQIPAQDRQVGVAHESLQTIDVHASTKRHQGKGTTEGVQRRRLDASSFGIEPDTVLPDVSATKFLTGK